MQITNSKELSSSESPISNASASRTDYGSTTVAESSPLNGSSPHNSDGDEHQISPESLELRTPSTAANSPPDISPPNADYSYQRLSGTDSRVPSFISLPASSNGRFRFNTMETTPNKNGNYSKPLEYSLNVLSHVLIGFITIYMSWLLIRVGLVGTALHAWLVTIGFVLLMSEGIMSYYSGNVLTFMYDRDIKTKIHWILQSTGGGLGMIGALLKLIENDFIIKSTHGSLGFAAFILCAFSLLSGLSALYSIRLKRLLSPLFTKAIHNLLGYVTYVIAILAQYYGYSTGYGIANIESDLIDLLKVITILALILTSIAPLQALYRKFQTIYRQYVN